MKFLIFILINNKKNKKMIFEQLTNDYIILLKEQGILLDANVIGVNEEFRTSTCVGKFIVDDVVVERYMCVYEDKGVITWKYLIPVKDENIIV
jgi:hypothetical protein